MSEDDQGLLIPPWEADDTATPRREEPSPQGLDFFISYAREDLDIVEWIAEQLRAEGFTISYQHADYGPGGAFAPAIDDDIARARRVIAVISQASLESKWCRAEWDAAGDKILPLRVQDVPVTGLRGGVTYVDLFGPGIGPEARKSLLTIQRTREPQETARGHASSTRQDRASTCREAPALSGET